LLVIDREGRQQIDHSDHIHLAKNLLRSTPEGLHPYRC
jgi:hypothetical protein